MDTSPLRFEADGDLAWAMLDACPDGLVVVDHQGTIQLVNRQTELLFGCERSELLGKSVEVLLPSHLQSLHESHRSEFSDAPEVRSMGSGMQLSARRNDGSEFPVEISLSPLNTDAGMCTLAAVRDITLRVEAEQREKQAAALFRSAFGDGPVPMTLTAVSATSDRVIIDANQAMADLLGIEVSDLIGMSFVDLTHPDDLASDSVATQAQLNGTTDNFQCRKRYLCADGSVVWVQLFVSVLTKHDDHIVTIGHSVDITAEVAAEVSRSRQSRSLEALGEIRAGLMSAEVSMQDTLDQLCRSTRDIALADSVVYCRSGRSGEQLRQLCGVDNRGNALGSQRLELDDFLATALRGEASVEAGAGSGLRMAVPVQEADRLEGVLVLTRNPDQDPFDQDDLLLVSSFAASTASALQLSDARAVQQRAELLEDRERIGRDMHDKVIGRLFATGMALQSTGAQMSDRGVQDRILGAVGELDDAIQEIRTTIYGLRSQLDWGKGARGEFLAVAADHRGSLGFEPRVDMTGPIDSVPTEVVDDALATLREALTNTAKYADASSVSITVGATTSELQMMISDDGVGFDSETTQSRADFHGNGLLNMASRAETLGGTFSFSSAPGEGMTIEWVVRFN